MSMLPPSSSNKGSSVHEIIEHLENGLRFGERTLQINALDETHVDQQINTLVQDLAQFPNLKAQDNTRLGQLAASLERNDLKDNAAKIHQLLKTAPTPFSQSPIATEMTAHPQTTREGVLKINNLMHLLLLEGDNHGHTGFAFNHYVDKRQEGVQSKIFCEPSLHLRMLKNDAIQAEFYFLHLLLERFPSEIYSLLKDAHLSTVQCLPIKIRCLRKMLNAIKVEIEHQKQILKNSYGELENPDLLSELIESQGVHRKELSEALIERKTFEEQWEKQLKELTNEAHKLYSRSLDQEAIQKGINDCFAIFKQLRELDCLSHEPFHVWLKWLGAFLDPQLLLSILIPAMELDPHQTLAIALHAVYNYFVYRKFPGVISISPLRILEALEELYPTDLCVINLKNKIMEKIDNDGPVSFLIEDPVLEYASIAKKLNEALNMLLADKITEAIELLRNLKKQLIGFSLLDNYLSLSWILQGDLIKAEQLFKRGANLLDLNFSPGYQPLYFLPVEGVKAADEFNRFLPLFIMLVHSKSQKNHLIENTVKILGEVHVTLATSLKNLETQNFSSSQYLHLFVFVFKWIGSVIHLFNKEEEIVKITTALQKILTVSAELCYQMNCFNEDNWFSTYLQRIIDEGTFEYEIIDSPSFPPPMHSNVAFDFTPKLELTPHSAKTAIVYLTKQSCYLLHNRRSYTSVDLVTDANATNESEADFTFPQHHLGSLPVYNKLLLQIFQQELEKPFKKNSRFNSTIQLIDELISSDMTANLHSHTTMEWTLFSIFSLSHFSPSTISLNKRIRELYYPKAYDSKIWEEQLKWLMKSCPFATQVEIHLRDAWNALESIEGRQKNKSPKILFPEDGTNLYAIFKFTQCIAGWSADETFEDWGKRMGCLAPIFPHSKNLNYDEKYDPKINNISLPLQTNKSHKIFQFLQSFLKKFHQATLEKNSHINSGNSDEGPTDSSWYSIDQKSWLKIIEGDCPEKHPKFSSFTPERKAELKRIVDNKRIHFKEYIALENNFNEKYKENFDENLKREDFVENAAYILTAIESRRSDVPPNIYFKHEKDARLVYQILLEVSIDRLFRFKLIELGYDFWENADLITIQNAFGPELDKIIGFFHGPEKHFFGEGPIQNHYNAKVHTLKKSPKRYGQKAAPKDCINTHIYFATEQYSLEREKEEKKE